MSMERALVARARPQMGAAMALALLQDEAMKGCTPTLAPMPVRLEPPYREFSRDMPLAVPEGVPRWEPETVPSPEALQRFAVWLAPNHECDWHGAERFIKLLQTCTHRVVFDIVGNREGVSISFLCHRNDAALLHAAFLAECTDCRLDPIPGDGIPAVPASAWAHAVFREYYPPPPYSHLFTRSAELKTSPLSPFITVASRLPATVRGWYQAVFAPVALQHSWHRNVDILCDFEFGFSQHQGLQPFSRHAQQVPSADLRGMALDTDQKAHADKGLYAAVVRVALLSEANEVHDRELTALAAFLSLFQHGGRPLAFVDRHDFAAAGITCPARSIFLQGLTYRAGFLVNSCELSGFVHLVSAPPLPERRHGVLSVLDGVPPSSPPAEADGTLVGYARFGSQPYPIRIPALLRGNHGHILGESGQGKSCLVETMVLQDVAEGQGAAIIDPHGDTVQHCLARIPESLADRVVYFAPGESDWIPSWNLLRLSPGLDASRVAHELVSAFQAVAEGWGDRVSHILRQVLHGLLLLGDATLLDAVTLLRGKSKERDRLLERLKVAVTNPMTSQFLQHDLGGYTRTEVLPALNKLAKLLDEEHVLRMVMQPENRFNFPSILAERRIFLADLSRIGAEARDVLGSFIVSGIYMAALGRSVLPPPLRLPYHVYIDEAHRFVTGPMNDIIAQTRKYRVSLTIIHQHLSQFSEQSVDALGTTGFSVVFHVLKKDADRLVRSIGGSVEPDDLTYLTPREALVRIGAEWTRVTTPEQPAEVDLRVREEIIAQSHARYYTRAGSDPYASMRNPGRGTGRAEFVTPCGGETDEDYAFDRLAP